MSPRNIDNPYLFKKKFKMKFRDTKLHFPEFDSFVSHLTENNTAYVVGGYLRDIQLEKNSRDIDLIIDTDEAGLDRMVFEWKSRSCKKNRMGGYKIRIEGLTVDFWSIRSEERRVGKECRL